MVRVHFFSLSPGKNHIVGAQLAIQLRPLEETSAGQQRGRRGEHVRGGGDPDSRSCRQPGGEHVRGGGDPDSRSCRQPARDRHPGTCTTPYSRPVVAAERHRLETSGICRRALFLGNGGLIKQGPGHGRKSDPINPGVLRNSLPRNPPSNLLCHIISFCFSSVSSFPISASIYLSSPYLIWPFLIPNDLPSQSLVILGRSLCDASRSSFSRNK